MLFRDSNHQSGTLAQSGIDLKLAVKRLHALLDPHQAQFTVESQAVQPLRKHEPLSIVLDHYSDCIIGEIESDDRFLCFRMPSDIE